MLWMGTFFNRMFVDWWARCSGIDLPGAYIEGYCGGFTADGTGILICACIRV